MRAPASAVRRASPALRHARRALAFGEDAVRLAVVADTHGQPHPAAAERLRACRPDAILHAGDIGSVAVLDALARIAPVHAVLGNIDERASGLPDALTLAVSADGDAAATLLLTHIALRGPRLLAGVARLAAAERASIVVCGHSHVPFLGRDRGLVVFNPGSIGPRRFHLPIVFGMIEVGREGVALRHIDCETGRRWLPPGVQAPPAG